MSEKKRIVFSNETPNDQGGIIPNDCLDFSRYQLNPVILRDHEWSEYATGLMTAVKFDGTNWSGIPDFHKITEDSKICSEMYEKGYLRSSSIGGEAIWKTTGNYVLNSEGERVPEPFLNEQGLKVCSKFVVYEVSTPTLPSNATAVTEDSFTKSGQFFAKCYSKSDILKANNSITNLITSPSFNHLSKTDQQKQVQQTVSTTKTAASNIQSSTLGTSKQSVLVAAANSITPLY